MNKIIRFASVIAIVCASLVYAGCTKDFSSDIARLEDEKATKADVKAVNDALEAFKTEATAQLQDLAAKKADKTTVEALQGKVADLEPIVTANKSNIAALSTTVGTIDAAVKALQADYARDIADLKNADTKIADDAAKALADAVAILNAEDNKLSENIGTLKSNVEILDKYVKDTFDEVKKEYNKLNEDQQKLIDGLTEDLGKLTARVDDIDKAIATLQSQMSQVLAMVQSLSFIPDTKGQAPEAYTFKKEMAQAGAADVAAKAVFQTSFQVTPKEAAGNINEDNLKIRVVGVKAFATEANDTLIKVTSVKVNEKTGYIDVIGAFDWKITPTMPDNKTLSVVAIYAQEGKDGFQENISTSVFPITVNMNAKPIQHVFAVNGKAVKEFAADSIVVTPSTDEAALEQAIFGDASKYEIYAQAVLGAKDTLVGPFDRIAALIDAKVDFLKPAMGDTTYSLLDTWSINNIKKFKVDTNYFATTVTPDTTVIAILKGSANKPVAYTGSISICGDSKVTGKYIIKPDEIKEDLGNKATIAWDWQKANWPLVNGVEIKNIEPKDVDNFVALVDNETENTKITITNKQSGIVYTSTGSNIDLVNSKKFKATVKAAHIEYGKKDSTYVVTVSNDKITGKIYTLTFEFTVKAIPDDIKIELPAKNTTLDRLSVDLKFDNDVLDRVVDKLAPLTEVEGGVTETLKNTLKTNIQGKFAVPAQPQDTTAIYGAQTIVKADSLKYGKIVLKNTFKLDYGIKVEATQTITVNKPVLTLNPVKEYVAGAGKHDYTVEVKSRIKNGIYTIDEMPFQEYLTVKGNDKSYEVKAKIHADSSQVVNGRETLALENGKKDIFEANVMEWGTLDTTSFKLGVSLETFDGSEQLDTATIKFWTKDPLKMTAKDTAVVQQIGQDTRVDLGRNGIISIKGLEGEELMSSAHTGLATITANDYKQKNLEFKIVEFNSEESKNFVSIVGNEFVLNQNHGALTADATFKIKASVEYIFGKKEVEFTVTVKSVE